jgi:hypothetical protein
MSRITRREAERSKKFVVFSLTGGHLAGARVMSSDPRDIARKRASRDYRVVLETNDREVAEQAVLAAAL